MYGTFSREATLPFSFLPSLHWESRLKLKNRGLTGGFLLLRIFSVAIFVSPHVCFILDLILISMFLR